ncbi:MAG: hypothetical protein IKW96_14525 [Ruminococcus sp.]|uniref:hypothetical protein n=1 Tax=Ruminococcus sp. TaxID=41978 RepID=UPI0025E72498|nr:hypothetical protein [Ruminococcus sp.]MBR5684466.1 hypothetical protein [Ruminococcus sp.]
MNKVEKVLIGVFGLGILIFLAYCITEGITGFGLAHGFEKGYCSEFGVILVVSCLGLFAVLVSHAMRNRKNKGKKAITNADRIWFRLSFVPFLLMLLYGVYSAFFGIDFLWSRSYGLDAFLIAVLFGGIALVVVPVLPLCIVWQVIYLIRRRKVKKAETAALQ